MYQKIFIVGNLGTDPERRVTPSGQTVTSFNVATNRKYNDTEETTWFRVSAWGRLAETCDEYLKKGRRVLVEGRLTPDAETGGPRIWTDQNGNPRASFEISAITVQFLGGNEQGHGFAPGADDEPF